MPFVFPRAQVRAQHMFVLTLTRRVCLHCNCTEIQEAPFVFARTHTRVNHVQKKKTQNAATQSPDQSKLEAAEFSPRSESKGGRKRNNELQRLEPTGSLKFCRRQQ